MMPERRCRITFQSSHPTAQAPIGAAQPRAVGSIELTIKPGGLGRFAQSGSSKALFPRTDTDGKTAVILNTAGGITGGDKFTNTCHALAGTRLNITTQTAERVYRAQASEVGTVKTELTVDAGARLDWLPQETILFDHCHLRRSLLMQLADDATGLIVEPMIFGRTEMGEVLHRGRLFDRITIRRGSRLVFEDRTALVGAIEEQLQRPGVAAGARAMAIVILAAPDAALHLDHVRSLLPQTGGASAIDNDLLVARILAPDGFGLRQSLVPTLTYLHGQALPRTWML